MPLRGRRRWKELEFGLAKRSEVSAFRARDRVVAGGTAGDGPASA
jgi:hypothetical protein